MFFDSIQWSAPSCTIIAGPSNSGKTSLLTKILIHKNNLFTTQNLKTILFFNQEQEIYKNWSDSGFINHSQKGIPSISDFQDITNFYSKGNGAIVIFDDLGGEISSNLHFFEHIFVVLSHHLNLTVFLVVHNLFEKSLRKISLNTNRFIITANYRDKSQIGFLSRQAFPKSKNFLTSVYNHILSSSPYGYLVLDFSQNRSEYLRISTRWFTTESVMVFTEQSSKCGGDPLKPFRCYHLIADNVFKLLNSSQTCNNINKNTNSVEINGLEKNVDGYTTYNKSLKQTDVGILNNPTNGEPSDTNNPILQQQTDHTVKPQLSNINTDPKQHVKLQSGVIPPTHSPNTTRKRYDGVKNKPKNTTSKLIYKRKIKKIPVKFNQKDFEDTPSNTNFINNSIGGNSVDTPNPKQSNLKSVSKKIRVQKNKFLSVKQNIFKDKNKITPGDETKKVGNSKLVPSFSKIFTKQKKKISFQDKSQQENNELVGHVGKQMVSQVDFTPILTDNNVNKKQHVKPSTHQVGDENITTQTVGTPKISQGATPAQPDSKINRVGNKRKPLKGLRPNAPPKIMKVNRGVKRPVPTTWDKPERKKGKKHNIVVDASSYDMWRL